MTSNEMTRKIQGLCSGVVLKDYKKHISVQVNVVDDAEGSFYIDVDQGVVKVEDGVAPHSEISFTASSETFIKLAKGELDPVKSVMSRKLKFGGELDKIFEFKRVVDLIKAERARMDKEAAAAK